MYSPAFSEPTPPQPHLWICDPMTSPPHGGRLTTASPVPSPYRLPGPPRLWPMQWALSAAAGCALLAFVLATMAGFAEFGVRHIRPHEAVSLPTMMAILQLAFAGVSAVVAFVVVYRRQRFAEVETDVAIRAQAMAEHGTAHWLYVQAPELIGSDEATVRSAALRSLERLAQSYPDLRQNVVDRICDYLRMPFEPPAAAQNSAAACEASHWCDSVSGNVPGTEASRELQVRHIAQNILARLLAAPWADACLSNRRQAHSSTYLQQVSVDLHCAVLVDPDFSDCCLGEADFRAAQFYGVARFDRTRFDEEAIFDDARFNDRAAFGGTKFGKGAAFRRACFKENASFGGAFFADAARFDCAQFHGMAIFGGARFTWARFSGAVFSGIAVFSGAQVVEEVRFNVTAFDSCALFSSVQAATASFGGVHFRGQVDFHQAWFGNVAFNGAEFNSRAKFTEVEYGTAPDLTHAMAILGDGGHVWPPGWHLEPSAQGSHLGQLVVGTGDQGDGPYQALG
jgi:uncharacterized protein YjbI with pentapeptide repeats